MSRLKIILFTILFLSLAIFGYQGCKKLSPPEVRIGGEMRSIVLAYTGQPESTLIRIAKEKGFFTKRGIDIKFQLHSYGKQCLKSVLEGKADIATVAETPIIFSVFQGNKVFIIANIFMSTANNAIIARKDKGILAPEDLKGKRIGFIPSTTSEYFMNIFLAANGLTKEDVIPVGYKRVEDMIPAISLGKVDALAIWNFELAKLRGQLANKGIAFFENDIYTETFNLVSKQDFIKKNPDVIKRLLSALIDAEEFIKSNQEEAQILLAKSLKVQDDLLRQIWDKNNYKVNLFKSLLITLEDESRWFLKNHSSQLTTMPDYRDLIYFDALNDLRPESITIMRIKP